MKCNLKLLGIIFIAVVAAFWADQAFAWNDHGHMTVAYLAYQRLTPATRDRVKTLLKLNPKYNDWAAAVDTQVPGASSADKDMMVFMIAATWADGIKRDPIYAQDGSHGGNRPDGSPDPARNTGYDDMLMHKYWHFIDTPFSRDGSALPAIPTPNVQDRIALFRNVLASAGPDPLKSYDLTWLLHLVGDVHQPLHSSTRVSKADPEGDAGGNLVKLDCSKCELHFFWDDLLGTKSDLPTVIRDAKELPRASASLAGKSDEKVWIAESFRDARRIVYALPVGPGDGPFRLTPQYKARALKLAKKRVALAGARLANLLNNELK